MSEENYKERVFDIQTQQAADHARTENPQYNNPFPVTEKKEDKTQ